MSPLSEDGWPCACEDDSSDDSADTHQCALPSSLLSSLFSLKQNKNKQGELRRFFWYEASRLGCLTFTKSCKHTETFRQLILSNTSGSFLQTPRCCWKPLVCKGFDVFLSITLNFKTSLGAEWRETTAWWLNILATLSCAAKRCSVNKGREIKTRQLHYFKTALLFMF